MVEGCFQVWVRRGWLRGGVRDGIIRLLFHHLYLFN